MAKRIITKIGDVFCVELDGISKRFFQYVANDMSQLNSSVIRVFSRNYPIDYVPNLAEITSDSVEFYAHTILKFGIEAGTWYKVGKSSDVGDVENIMFRYFSELDHSKMTKSYRWYIWKINQERVFIGEMQEKYLKYDIGVVFTYKDIYSKIKTGKYIFKLLD